VIPMATKCLSNFSRHLGMVFPYNLTNYSLIYSEDERNRFRAFECGIGYFDSVGRLKCAKHLDVFIESKLLFGEHVQRLQCVCERVFATEKTGPFCYCIAIVYDAIVLSVVCRPIVNSSPLGMRSIAVSMSACLLVSVCWRMLKTTCLNFTKFSIHCYLGPWLGLL